MRLTQDDTAVVDRKPLAAASVRFIAVACLVAGVASAGLIGASNGRSVIVGGTTLLLALDVRNPLSLKNFFLVYTVGLFAVGETLFDSVDSVSGDLLLYLLSFLFGYSLSSAKAKGYMGRVKTTSTTVARVGPDRIRVLEEMLLIVLLLELTMLALNVGKFGVGGFYGGMGLVEQLAGYGTPSVSGGVTQIVAFLVRYSAIAAVILLVHTCLASGTRIRYLLPALVLVILPIVSLARSDALTGAGLLLVIYAVERRMAPRPRGAVGKRPAKRPYPIARRRTLALSTVMGVAVVAAFAIGNLRETGNPNGEAASTVERSLPLLQSEFSPIQAYSEIRANEEVLGRPLGSTIALPLVFKVLPRGLFPEKPINSGAYYMSILRPAEFAAGFAIPPTLFGDVLLNFGFFSAIIAAFALGLFVARVDVAYKKGQLSRLPWFLLLYINFYGLLRNPLSESLAALLLTTATWLTLRHVLGRSHLPVPVSVAARNHVSA